MKFGHKFALSSFLAIPVALALSGCPGGDDGGGDGGPSGNFCLHSCTADADCTIMGMDQGLTCQAGTCTGEAPDGCTSNEECIATFSGWITPCTAGGGECDLTMQVCVDVGGSGLCATPPSDVIDCATLMMEEVEVTDIDGSPVTVCGNSSAECNSEGACWVPCGSDADCSGSTPVCNTGTGLCECGTDDDCAMNMSPAASVCRAGTCGCGVDQDCVDANLGDVCYDGLCGCSGDDVCADVPNVFDGGQISCQSV